MSVYFATLFVFSFSLFLYIWVYIDIELRYYSFLITGDDFVHFGTASDSSRNTGPGTDPVQSHCGLFT